LWPSFIPDIINALNSQNERGIITGLLALKGFVKNFKYEMGLPEGPILQAIQKVFEEIGKVVNEHLISRA
jgi:hypothetical protein